jgi:hypothetical protein
MWQTNHKWVSVNIFKEHPSEIRERASVETLDAFSGVDVSDHSEFVFQRRLCLPLSLDGLQGLLDGETYHSTGDTHSCTHQNDF